MGDPSKEDTEKKLNHLSKMKEKVREGSVVSMGDWKDILSVEENLKRRLERIEKGRSK